MNGADRHQGVRKKWKAIMILYGSTVALIASFCAWPKGRNFFSLLMSRIYLQLRYQVMATKELYYDFRDAKYNKTGKIILF